MNGSKVNTGMLINVAVIGAAGFAIWKILDSLKGFNKDTPYEGYGAVGTAANAMNQASGGALAAAGGAIGRTLYTWLNPGAANATGEMTYYGVIFPDGVRHAVGASTVTKEGLFTREGKRWRIKVDAAGKMYAVVP